MLMPVMLAALAQPAAARTGLIDQSGIPAQVTVASGPKSRAVSSLSCSGTPPDKRCWVWSRRYGRGRSTNKLVSGRLACGLSSDGGYIFQDGPPNPSYGDPQFPNDTPRLPKLVSQASIQMDQTGQCFFKPYMEFTLSSLVAGAHPQAAIYLQSQGPNDVPLKDIYITFPRGMTVYEDAVPHCNAMPSGVDADTDCSSASDIGDLQVISDVYSTQLNVLGQRGYMQAVNFSRGSNLFMGPKGRQAQYGDPPDSASYQSVGYLWLVLNARYWVGQTAIDIGDDVVMGMHVFREDGQLKGQLMGEWDSTRGRWSGVPREKPNYTIPWLVPFPRGVYIALNDLTISLNGAAGSPGSELLTNPLPGQCTDGDPLSYLAFHQSHLDDIPWRPDRPQDNVPAGHSPSGQSYLNLAWSQAGGVSGC